ncbi:hypothetical protein KAU40_00410 [Candidatus Parcubacteria bacterium]|nr:hypothetical protein [Candidatus Parcubacteria bacterium]
MDFFKKVLIVCIVFLIGGFAYFIFFGSENSEKDTTPEPALETNHLPKVKSLSSAFGCGIHNVAFFWRFSDIDENDFQSGFQIQIDDEEDFTSPLFDSQKSDVWSLIEADYFRYDLPKELPEAQEYFWRVRIWDNKDKVSDWSRKQILPI